MGPALMIYGAGGFSGQRIVEAARALPPAAGPVVLAGRDGAALKRLSDESGFDFRVFALDTPADVRRGLAGIGVVLNAAGPFALTAERLAKSAIAAGCDYVDINGEADVYRRLDDLRLFAAESGTALVSGAGFTATVSSMMLAQALAGPLDKVDDIGSVRIAYSAVDALSRGSLAAAWRSVREQVLVVRPDPRRPVSSAPAWVPVGQLQKTFAFQADAGQPPRHAVASAVNMVDTLVARSMLRPPRKRVQNIESYLETGTWAQLALDAGALAAPLAGVGLLGRAFGIAIAALPPGPRPAERRNARQAVVLQVEDGRRRTLVDWCVQAPGAYDATAPLALAVSEVLRARPRRFTGWRTPGEVLALGDGLLPAELWKGFSIVRRAGSA